MGQIKFTDYVPLNIVGVNSASKTLAADNVTGMPIPTGVGVGESFYISAKNAALLSTAYYPVYPGWYRVVQVDTGATAANIVYGAIGGQANLTNARLENNVTDQANVLSQGIAPCVFLTGGLGLIVNSAYVSALPAMTPGNFTIVQDSGDATVLVAAGQTVAVGSVLVAAAGVGTVTVLAGTVVANTLATVVGVAEAAVTTPSALTGASVVAASGGVAAYHGTYTGGGANAFAGMQAVVTGAQYAVNNGTFLITASSATVLTLANPAAVAETHAHTATLQALVRVRLGFPFGQRI